MSQPNTAETSVRLTPCSVCGREIAMNASTCTQCGAPNVYTHPKVSEFLNQKFKGLNFQYKTTAFTVTGEIASDSNDFRQIAGACIFLSFVVSIFLPALFWLLVIPSIVFLAYAMFFASKTETFRVDLSGEKPVWNSTNDELWKPVKLFFFPPAA